MATALSTMGGPVTATMDDSVSPFSRMPFSYFVRRPSVELKLILISIDFTSRAESDIPYIPQSIVMVSGEVVYRPLIVETFAFVFARCQRVAV